MMTPAEKEVIAYHLTTVSDERLVKYANTMQLADGRRLNSACRPLIHQELDRRHVVLSLNIRALHEKPAR